MVQETRANFNLSSMSLWMCHHFSTIVFTSLLLVFLYAHSQSNSNANLLHIQIFVFVFWVHLNTERRKKMDFELVRWYILNNGLKCRERLLWIKCLCDGYVYTLAFCLIHQSSMRRILQQLKIKLKTVQSCQISRVIEHFAVDKQYDFVWYRSFTRFLTNTLELFLCAFLSLLFFCFAYPTCSEIILFVL